MGLTLLSRRFPKLTAVVVDVEMLMRALVGPPTSTVTGIIVN